MPEPTIIPRRSKDYLEEIKHDFKDKCCFKINPIPSEVVFTRMGLDYTKDKDKQFLYGCVRRWNKETIKELNFEILTESPIEMKEAIYKRFLERCWLEKLPFGLFNYGNFYTPLKYVQYEAILNRQAIRAILGTFTSLKNMATKGMMLNGKIPANLLANIIYDNIKLLDISEKEMEDIKQLGLDTEHYFKDK